VDVKEPETADEIVAIRAKEWTFCPVHEIVVKHGTCHFCGGDRHLIQVAYVNSAPEKRLRALLDRDLETMRDLEDYGAYGYSEGGCVLCWSTGEHNPTKPYPIEHTLGCPVKAAIDRLVAAGAVDSIHRLHGKDE
jgi:hypothetical protein